MDNRAHLDLWVLDLLDQSDLRVPDYQAPLDQKEFVDHLEEDRPARKDLPDRRTDHERVHPAHPDHPVVDFPDLVDQLDFRVPVFVDNPAQLVAVLRDQLDPVALPDHK